MPPTAQTPAEEAEEGQTPSASLGAAQRRRLDALRERRRAAQAQWQALTPRERADSEALAEAERLASAAAACLGPCGPG